MEEPHLYDFYVDHVYPVEPTSQIKVTKNIKDLADFAQEHGISYKTLKRFNPWLRQTSLKVGKHKTYYIAIPETSRHTSKNIRHAICTSLPILNVKNSQHGKE